MRRSVAGVLIHLGKVFVAQRGASGSFHGRWEFPGGKVEDGESDEEALEREFQEEFGIEVRPLKPIGECVFPHRGEDRVLAAWLIELAPFTKPTLLEHEAVAWVAAEDLRALDMVDSDRQLLSAIIPLMG